MKTLFQIMQHRSCTYHIHTHRITINLIELQAALIPLLGSRSYTRSGKTKPLTLRTPTKIQVVQIKSIESRILPRRVLRQDCRKEERRFTPVTPYLELFVFFFRITDANIKHRPLLVSTRTDHPKMMLVC